MAASIEDLARASSVIARVTALDRESAWEDGRIVTYSRVRIDEIVAGSTAGNTREVRIRTLGGSVGNIGQTVEGEAVLTLAQPAIVFLGTRSPQRTTDLVVMGRAQGLLLVRRDVTGREIVRLGPVGELIARKIRPPIRATGKPVVELDGASVDAVVIDAKRAWEVGHAR